MYYLIIPAFEPDQKLIKLLEDAKQHLNCQIIFVNDGSSLHTKPIFKKASEFAMVLDHPKNMGKGQALRTAFRYVQSLDRDAVIVTADADGQHSVRDIDRVAHAAAHLPNRLILGVREFTKEVPLRSRLGNKLTRLLFKIQTGVAVTDTQTGLRAFQTQMIPFMLGIEGDRYEYEMNMLTQASQKYLITEVPIETIYIDDNASSHFRPIRDSLMIYKNLFKFALASFGGFVIDYLVYAVVLLTFSWAPTTIRLLLANSLGRITSSVCNFRMNKSLVFDNHDSVTRTGTGYFSLVVILFVCDTALQYFLHSLLGINFYLVKILVGTLLFFVSWFIQKHFIFQERKTFSHEIY